MSGGRDSKYTTLRLKEVEYWIKKEIILLYQDTGLNIAESKEVVEHLSEITGWKLEIVSVPRVKNKVKIVPMALVKESMKNVEYARQLANEGKYSKKSAFPCCEHLKINPFMDWLKQKDKINCCFILGIKLGDGWRRRKWLLDLIENQEKFWFNRQKQTWYYYPLRETVTKDVDMYLTKDEKFWNIKSTGCKVCPILVTFNIEKEGKRYYRSLKLYNKLMATNDA